MFSLHPNSLKSWLSQSKEQILICSFLETLIICNLQLGLIAFLLLYFFVKTYKRKKIFAVFLTWIHVCTYYSQIHTFLPESF